MKATFHGTCLYLKLAQSMTVRHEAPSQGTLCGEPDGLDVAMGSREHSGLVGKAGLEHILVRPDNLPLCSRRQEDTELKGERTIL